MARRQSSLSSQLSIPKKKNLKFSRLKEAWEEVMK
jgi:hypothetical protein